MLRAVHVRPLVPVCIVELGRGEVVKTFQSRVLKLTKDRVFLNDSIHGGNVFIIVFEADGSVVNN